ncbi:hypothetical protein BDV93DRAFT_512887 [Ceratobasidium sp. AG-I]|nr:hypothetical protein BDV93DRAFT_512887 [Ceratobasidium sp. AG-I]
MSRGNEDTSVVLVGESGGRIGGSSGAVRSERRRAGTDVRPALLAGACGACDVVVGNTTWLRSRGARAGVSRTGSGWVRRAPGTGGLAPHYIGRREERYWSGAVDTAGTRSVAGTVDAAGEWSVARGTDLDTVEREPMPGARSAAEGSGVCMGLTWRGQSGTAKKRGPTCECERGERGGAGLTPNRRRREIFRKASTADERG